MKDVEEFFLALTVIYNLRKLYIIIQRRRLK